jgi:hypothetical protein
MLALRMSGKQAYTQMREKPFPRMPNPLLGETPERAQCRLRTSGEPERLMPSLFEMQNHRLSIRRIGLDAQHFGCTCNP